MAKLSYALVPVERPVTEEEITFTVRGEEIDTFIGIMGRIPRTPRQANLSKQFFDSLEDYRKRVK